VARDPVQLKKETAGTNGDAVAVICAVLMPLSGIIDCELRITPSFPGIMRLTSAARDRCRNGAATTGKYWKQNAWVSPATKMLLADAKFYQVEQLRIASGVIPGQESNLSLTYSLPTALPGQSLYDLHRHGVNPPLIPGGTRFQDTGGKVAFNILYCDGHVKTAIAKGRGLHRHSAAVPRVSNCLKSKRSPKPGFAGASCVR
jgi:prepilin-type processing-associated H-X9-DG protein